MILRKKIKFAAIGILFLPIGFLLLFLIGEVFSGDLTGLGHLIQLLPLLVLAWFGYKNPYWSGVFMSLIGLTFGVIYAMSAGFYLETILIVEAVLFLPIFVSGVLLILAGKKSHKLQN